MTLYSRNMNQAATHWPKTGVDTFGQSTYGSPAAIKCRWQDKAELFRDADGNEVTSSAVVYPNTSISIGDKIQLGTQAGAPTTAAREVRQVGSSPSLGGGRELVKVWL